MKDEIKEIDNSDLMELLETTSKKEFYRLTLDHELVVRLYNWLTNLQQENEIKTTKLNAIRKYLLNNKLYTFKYDDEELFEITTDKKAKDELLNILNGGDKK